MTIKQKVIKALYPAFLWASSLKNKKERIKKNEKNSLPKQSIYDLSVTLNNGTNLPIHSLKGKKILMVNTASECGYTPQYEGLETLYKENMEKLIIIGFPANDFGEQEKGDDATIAEFCKVNFGVSFPLSTKSTVIPNTEQHPVFKWLTQPDQNGWNSQSPNWNFCKYLVDENGVLLSFFDSSVSPISEELTKML